MSVAETIPAEVANKWEAIEAFNAATGYALDPQGNYGADTLADMMFVATVRGQLHVVTRLKEAFASAEFGVRSAE